MPEWGRVAVVTGASSGLGAELARQLAQNGWRVGLTARRAVELARVAETIRGEGGRAVFAPADAADREATAAAFRSLTRQLGPVDLLIANAGVGEAFTARQLDVEGFRRMVDVNLLGPVHAISNVLPDMIAQGSGQIVGISSLAGYRGLPGASGYSSTKAGLSALLEGLRSEVRRLGVGITVVHPGYIRTPMTEGQANAQPFLMEVEPAARIILRGIEQRRTRIDFPGPMVALLRAARLLPDRVYDAVVARVLLGPRPPRPPRNPTDSSGIGVS